MKKATLAGKFLKVKELRFGLDDAREQKMGVVSAAWLVDVQHYQLQVGTRTMFEDNMFRSTTWQFFLILNRTPDVTSEKWVDSAWRNGKSVDPSSVIYGPDCDFGCIPFEYSY